MATARAAGRNRRPERRRADPGREVSPARPAASALRGRAVPVPGELPRQPRAAPRQGPRLDLRLLGRESGVPRQAGEERGGAVDGLGAADPSHLRSSPRRLDRHPAARGVALVVRACRFRVPLVSRGARDRSCLRASSTAWPRATWSRPHGSGRRRQPARRRVAYRRSPSGSDPDPAMEPPGDEPRSEGGGAGLGPWSRHRWIRRRGPAPETGSVRPTNRGGASDTFRPGGASDVHRR